MKALRTPYFIFANTVILLVLVLAATHLAIRIYYHFWHASQYRQLPGVVKRNYVHMTPAEVDEHGIRILRHGYRPSAVLFLDGVNESCDMDDYQEEMKRLFAKAQEGHGWDPLGIVKPVTYAFDKLSNKLKKLAGLTVDRPAGDQLVCKAYGKSLPPRAIHAQVLAERESLCRLYAIPCKTSVQPFGGVHGRYDDPAFLEKDRKMKREKFLHLEAGWRTAGAIFVTDALDRYERHAYLDEEHYSAAASELIPRAIAPHLVQDAGARTTSR